MADTDTTTAAGGSPDDMGETSKQGLRRMRRLAADPPTLRDSRRMAIHHDTATLIYPAPPSSPISGHVITSLSHPRPPRPLPLPSIMAPSKYIWTTPDGGWLVAFHPDVVGEGGNLAIYSRSILSPLTTPSNSISHSQSNLALDKPPIQVLSLYPPRMHIPSPGTATTSTTSGESETTQSSLAPQLGPAPPPGYEAKNGPVLLVLTSTSLMLVHPHPIQRQTQMNGYDQNQKPTWTSTTLRCPLNMRWRAVMGEQVPPDSGYAIERGWMGLVPGNAAAWVGVERNGEIAVVRAEVGIDRMGRWYLETTPLGTLTLGASEGSPENIHRRVQGVNFIPLANGKAEKREDDAQVEPKDGVSTVIVEAQVTSALDDPAGLRTRLTSFEIQRREVELVASLTELSGQTDPVKSWDWFVTSIPTSDTGSPAGICVEAMELLPSISQEGFSAMAVISTPRGLVMSHLNLKSSNENPSGIDTWASITGKQLPLGTTFDTLSSDLAISCSQGSRRGGVGLVALWDGNEVHLIPSSRIGQEVTQSDSLGQMAIAAAKGIQCADEDGSNWSDVLRASLGSIPLPKRIAFARDEIKAISRSDSGDDSQSFDSLLRFHIALFAASGQPNLRDISSEMLRLHQVATLFSSAASFEPDGTISFSLGTVWPLVSVSEWVFATLASILRDTLILRAEVQDLPSDLGGIALSDLTVNPFRALHLLQPEPRRTILLLLSQLRAFALFVSRLDRPIPQPETRYMPVGVAPDARATILAKDRTAGAAMSEGVPVELWGRAIQALPTPKNAEVNDLASISSYAQLEPAKLVEHLKSLSSLPSPSALFISETEPQCYDAISFQPIPRDTGLRCDTCGNRTVSLTGKPWNAGLKSEEEMDAWEKWRLEREKGCICGGNWERVR